MTDQASPPQLARDLQTQVASHIGKGVLVSQRRLEIATTMLDRALGELDEASTLPAGDEGVRPLLEAARFHAELALDELHASQR